MCEALRPEPHPRNAGEGGEEGLGGRSPQGVVVRPAPPSGALGVAADASPPRCQIPILRANKSGGWLENLVGAGLTFIWEGDVIFSFHGLVGLRIR